ncbi:DUF1330 domain-containing protein [Mycobacterium sp. CVI_P3]|uniref:DUF1330 domain-containing protein n=1 Tax=Mycobacterium pinniadriaticum TaxID=2994102 RepID=A0ABT3SJE9_9MYCO|nr:DUF1330 domain-containing protein [Mycobacterium pinniadriaticum]MCX2932546.1 DUF1330 domain-containing protein [Mycobacterium pinniadriaticum]MCX2939010.1 DUF1330 domain-containing protein [Mycobacterium pinniadriaticum]
MPETTRPDQPIAMFNTLWFRPDGMQLYGEYGGEVLPILADVGAELVTPFLMVDEPLEGGFDPDMVGFVRYPSAAAFDDMVDSDRYRRVAHLRSDAVHRAVLTRCAIEPPDPGAAVLEPGIAVLNMLWFHDGGRQRYAEYLSAVKPLVEAAGGRFAVVTDPAYAEVGALRTAAVRESATTILTVL